MISTIIKNLKSDLSKREEEVLDLRFGLKGQRKSLSEIGRKYGITRERVRQIQNKILKNLGTKIKESLELKPIFKAIDKAFKETNDFKILDSLFDDLKIKYSLDEKEKPYLYLLLSIIPEIEKIKADDFHHQFFVKNIKSKKIKTFFHHISFHFENKKLKWQDFVAEVKKEFEKVTSEKLNEKTIEEILLISHHLWVNPFNEAGHLSSPFIVPKNTGHKILSIFYYHNRPLHYKEIYEELLKIAQKHHRLIHPNWKEVPTLPTIHNELIFRPEFVIAGRGLYALKEWNYSGLFVKDLILEILENSKKPISQDELIKLVLGKKLVKPNTVKVILHQLKDKIKILPNGLISL